VATVVDVLITDPLASRPARLPDHAADTAALHALAGQLAEDPSGLLPALAAPVKARLPSGL
jgi:hypothetical protein